jgi:prolyl-tRNA editing enzyme YbaK/EbsC (Cys-tRNA(Pro) deacylase)
MSKSLRRVERALADAGIATEIRELGACRTAAEAAASAGCEIDQIAKSVIFRGGRTGRALLFLTAGGNQVDGAKAATLAGEPLEKADAAFIRAETGFAIGGVAPLGHLAPPRAWADPRLLDFAEIWGAAGTPRHVFPADPRQILRVIDAQVADFTRESEKM